MKLKYGLCILILVMIISSLYIFTNKHISFVLMSNGYCQQENAIGGCRVYMVKGFSKWHLEKHLEEIKMHALSVNRDSLGNQCPSNIVYFLDSRWTEENRDSFGSSTMEEMDSWDKNTNFFFSGMARSFLCRVYFNCNNGGALVWGLDRDYIYGDDDGYLE